jgi:hypothetical protein
MNRNEQASGLTLSSAKDAKHGGRPNQTGLGQGDSPSGLTLSVAANTLGVGSKIYHFVFGPMTILKIDHQYMTVAVDDISGVPVWSGGGKYDPYDADGLEPSYINNCPKDFLVSAIGYWYFTDENDIGKETAVAPIGPGPETRTLIINRKLTHRKYLLSGVTFPQSKEPDEVSPLTAAAETEGDGSPLTAMGKSNKDLFEKPGMV